VNGPPAPGLDLFHGQLSSHTAHVYARVASMPGGGQWSLAGQVHGPHCRRARTLPVSAPLADLGPGPTLLARATVAAPCFWSSELPAVYRVKLELRCDEQTVASYDRIIGLRQFGARGHNLYWEGKRWVLRGIHRASVEDCPWAEWREAAAAIVADRPDETLCREASLEGVLVVARVNGDQRGNFAEELRRLAQWPAVGVVWLTDPGSWLVSPGNLAPKELAPNVLAAVSRDASVAAAPEWADITVFDARPTARALVVPSGDEKPKIAVRRIGHRTTLAAARAACDDLQRDLAVAGDCAGYLV
jgi:hypothetical protein